MTDTTPSSAESLDANFPNDADRLRRERVNQMLLNVARGDEKAFAELYRATSSRVFGIVVRMIHDRGEAEDILQEIYATAWRRADTFDPKRGSSMTWLITLGRNRSIDRMRQHREELLDEPTPARSPTNLQRPPARPNRARSGGGWNTAWSG